MKNPTLMGKLPYVLKTMDFIKSLLGFHASTRTDSTSAFARQGKLKPPKILEKCDTTLLRVVSIGLLTLRRLHLAAQYQRNLLPLCLPIRCRLREEKLSLQDAKSQGEGGEGRLRAQPLSAQRLAPLTS